MHLSLRQMEKMFGHIRLALQTFGEEHIANPDVLLMLMYFRANNADFYSRLKGKSLSAQDLLTEIEGILPKRIFIKEEYDRLDSFRHSVWGVAQLIVSYNIDWSGRQREQLLVKGSSNDSLKLLIAPTVIPKDEFQEAIKWYVENSYGANGTVPLDSLIQHLELLYAFQV